MRLVTVTQRRAAVLQGVAYGATIAGTLVVLAWILDVYLTGPYQLLVGLAAVGGYLGFRRYDLIEAWNPGQPGSVGRRVLLAWVLLVAALLFLGYAFKFSAYFSRQLLLVWMFVTPFALFGLHLATRWVARRYGSLMSMQRSAVIIFINDSARALARNLENSPYYDLKGYFDDREPDRFGGGLEHVTFLGKGNTAADYVRRHHIQVCFVVLPDGANKRVLGVLDELTDTTASVYYVPDFFVFSLMQAQISEVEGVPMLQVVETPFYGVDGVLKRAFDVVFASAALVLLAPLMLLIAAVVKLDSPGPALFAQKRYGLDGRPFRVLKFRSMRSEEARQEFVQAKRDDPRITRIGRFLRRSSLDELPQFWNVLRGEMSVVGPRPHPVAMNEHYRKAVKHYMVRHKVRPGLTGWAQVHGLRGETAQLERMTERIRYDIDYIRNWSIWLDLQIVAMTLLMIVRDKNAY